MLGFPVGEYLAGILAGFDPRTSCILPSILLIPVTGAEIPLAARRPDEIAASILLGV